MNDYEIFLKQIGQKSIRLCSTVCSQKIWTIQEACQVLGSSRCVPKRQGYGGTKRICYSDLGTHEEQGIQGSDAIIEVRSNNMVVKKKSTDKSLEELSNRLRNKTAYKPTKATVINDFKDHYSSKQTTDMILENPKYTDIKSKNNTKNLEDSKDQDFFNKLGDEKYKPNSYIDKKDKQKLINKVDHTNTIKRSSNDISTDIFCITQCGDMSLHGDRYWQADEIFSACLQYIPDFSFLRV